MTLAKTTKLEAVNSMLLAVDQSPVTDLTQQTADVISALTFLDRASREVQTEGWKFNTKPKVLLTPDGSGLITLTDDVVNVRLDPLKYPVCTYDVELLGNSLVNRVGDTDQFSAAIEAEVTYLLDWESLPEHVRSYVMLKARREFQSDVMSSDNTTSTQSRDELQAFIKLKRRETINKPNNYLDTFRRGI